MKKIKLIISLIAVIAFTSASYGQLATSAHDFSDGAGFDLDAWNTSPTNAMCGPCHVPHGGEAVDAPLWSHTLTNPAGFTVYTSTGSLDATDIAAPAGVSLKCLSCHDGSIALDAHLSASGTPSTTVLSGAALVGTDLTNDHPVSFTYNPGTGVGLDAGLNAATSTPAILGGATIAEALLFGAGNTEVECASCHDPHNSGGFPSLMRYDNSSSQLCLACHNK